MVHLRPRTKRHYNRNSTISPGNNLPQCIAVKKKRSHFPEPCPTYQGYVTLPLKAHTLTGGHYHHPILQVTAKLICAEHPVILRSVNPCPNTVHMEPFPTRYSKIMFEYLLLPPRSAAFAIPHYLSPHV